MSEILFIAPSSYPLGNPEAYVNAKVIKALSEGGHILDVVSLKSKRRDRAYPPEEDKFYFAKVRSLNVLQINTGKNFSTVCNHIGCFLKTGFVYKGSDWAYKCIRFCERLIKQHKYDYIYTYDYPSEVAGLYLSKKYGIRWVATWNDPYTWVKYPAPYADGVNGRLSKNRQKLIKEIGKFAFKNIFPNSRLRDYMLQYMEGMKKKDCVVSPHIVCKDLVSNDCIRHEGTLKIIHSGSIGRERNPQNLFLAIKKITEEDPNINLEVTFLGINDRGDPKYIEQMLWVYNIRKYIRFLPPVNYSNSLKLLSNYDVCLIIEADLKEGIFLPSKVADYFQKSKPIFALSPKIGVLDDLYTDGLIPYKADISDVDSIASALKIVLQDFKDENINFNPKVQKIFSDDSILEIHNKFLK